jgi:ribosomal protein S12 methylthiotransferase
MRGKHRSFALDDLVREAQLLEAQGAREINLVAQDLAHYGRDRRDGNALPELLEALLRETTIPWIRNMYLYSTGITPRLLEVIAANPRIVRWLDTPMQHGSDAVLARMRRPERQKTIRERLAMYRAIVPDLAVRTSVIVGFPGETEDDFRTLCDFLEEMQFDRVGVFTYSPQEGTRAFGMDDDVADSIKQERKERVEELQRAITAERYERFLGREARVLVERAGESPAVWTCRAPWQADDIDGLLHVTVPEALLAAGARPAPGAFLDVRVDQVVDDYDFTATLLRVADLPATATPTRPTRTLPLVGLDSTTAGSFGR